MKLQKASFLVNDNALDLASPQEDKAQDHDDNRDSVLPPMTFSVSFEKRAMVAKCQMVDQVQCTSNDERTSDP